MSEIMVSVCCTAYNHEKYIRDALESFVHQETDFVYEVIVHDDASTDSTADIIREYEAKYPEIIKPIYQTENQYSKRLKINHTFLFPKARGKYIALCEADDYWTDMRKLQKQVDFLESHEDFSACVHNTRCIDLRSGEERNLYGDEEKVLGVPDAIYAGGQSFHTSALLYRREYALNRPDYCYITKSVGDYPTAIYLTSVGKVEYLPEVMSVYRWFAEGSWSATKMDVEKQVRNFQEVIDMLEAFDVYTEHRYHDDVTKALLPKRFDMADCQCDFEVIHSEEMKNYYRELPFSQKMRLFLKEHFRTLYKLYCKVKG